MVTNESDFRVKVAVRVSREEETVRLHDEDASLSFRFVHFCREKKHKSRKVVWPSIEKPVRLFWAIGALSSTTLSSDRKRNR